MFSCNSHQQGQCPLFSLQSLSRMACPAIQQYRESPIHPDVTHQQVTDQSTTITYHLARLYSPLQQFYLQQHTSSPFHTAHTTIFPSPLLCQFLHLSSPLPADLAFTQTPSHLLYITRPAHIPPNSPLPPAKQASCIHPSSPSSPLKRSLQLPSPPPLP